MKPTKPTTLELGTISHGTMRVQDTMPALLSALDGIRLSAEDRQTCDEVQRCLDAWIAADCEDDDSDNPGTMIAGCAPCSDDLLFDLEMEMSETLIPLAESYRPRLLLCRIASR